MNVVRISRPLVVPGYYAPLEASIEFDTDDEGAIVRGMNALRRLGAATEGRYSYRCPGCFVGPGIVHVLDCPNAPDGLIESLRGEMMEALGEALR